MKTNFKLTDEKMKELKLLADKLPRTVLRDDLGRPVKGGVSNVSGFLLLRAGFKDHYGKKIVPGQIYKVRKTIYDNHYLNLTTAWKKGGNKEVVAYLKMIRERSWYSLSFGKKVKALRKFLVLRFTRLFNK